MADDQVSVSRVLIFGHDNGLLVTRQLLLERDGCQVHVVRWAKEFRTCVLGQTFELILLCQSLSPDECESAAKFAQEHAPTTRLLLMFTRVGKCIPEHADVLLDSLSGPKVFVETARRMLASASARAIRPSSAVPK
jgi:hypothetical protein